MSKNNNIFDDDGREMGVLYPVEFTDINEFLKQLRHHPTNQSQESTAGPEVPNA